MSNKVLVTGASGLLGVAAIEKFLSAGWEVIGVSRRKPELPSDREIEFLPADEVMSRNFQQGLNRLGVDWFPSIEINSTDSIESYVANGFGIGLTVSPSRF